MINSKETLRQYLLADAERYKEHIPWLKDFLVHNESWYIWQYIKSLRHLEYYINTGQKRSIAYAFWWLRYKRLSLKTHITIMPNTCGPGLHIYHLGDMTWVKSNVKLGKNCTLRAGVVLGNKGPEKDDPIIVGDNVDFGLGVKIFGPVNIGSNVIIGANSVVTKDIPDNAVVGGVPAKIIRINESR